MANECVRTHEIHPDGTALADWQGLSTDTKPTERVANGATYFELDTKKIFMFSILNLTAASSHWWEV